MASPLSARELGVMGWELEIRSPNPDLLTPNPLPDNALTIVMLAPSGHQPVLVRQRDRFRAARDPQLGKEVCEVIFDRGRADR